LNLKLKLDPDLIAKQDSLWDVKFDTLIDKELIDIDESNDYSLSWLPIIDNMC